MTPTIADLRPTGRWAPVNVRKFRKTLPKVRLPWHGTAALGVNPPALRKSPPEPGGLERRPGIKLAAPYTPPVSATPRARRAVFVQSGRCHHATPACSASDSLRKPINATTLDGTIFGEA